MKTSPSCVSIRESCWLWPLYTKLWRYHTLLWLLPVLVEVQVSILVTVYHYCFGCFPMIHFSQISDCFMGDIEQGQKKRWTFWNWLHSGIIHFQCFKAGIRNGETLFLFAILQQQRSYFKQPIRFFPPSGRSSLPFHRHYHNAWLSSPPFHRHYHNPGLSSPPFHLLNKNNNCVLGLTVALFPLMQL